MSKPEPRFNVDPETGEMVEIDEELDAALAEAIASSERGESIPLEVFLKRWDKRRLSRSKQASQRSGKSMMPTRGGR